MTAETPVTPSDEDGAGGKMPLLDHLIELRSRLLKSLVAIALAFGVCLYFAEPIFSILVQPLVRAGCYDLGLGGFCMGGADGRL